MRRKRRTRALSIQEPEDNAVKGDSPSRITLSAQSVNKPLGRPRRNPLRSKAKRKDLAYESSDQTDISDHIATKKQKRTLPGDACSTCLQTGCRGCSRKPGALAENRGQHLVAIAREGIQRADESSQWECRDRSRPLNAEREREEREADVAEVAVMEEEEEDQEDGGDDEEEEESGDEEDVEERGTEATPEREARDTTIVTEELDPPRITDCYRGLVNFSKTTVIQAQEEYKEARGLLDTVYTELEECRERFVKLKGEIERRADGLEEYRRQYESNDVQPAERDSEHSMSHRLALGVCGDTDWEDKVSGKIDLIMAEEFELTSRLKSIQDDVEIKLTRLKRDEQQYSEFSACLRDSCEVFKRLRSKVATGFIKDSWGDSDFVSESTIDVPLRTIAAEIGHPGEDNQQCILNDGRGQMRALSQVSETAEESGFISPGKFELSHNSPEAEVVAHNSLHTSQIVIPRHSPETEVAGCPGIASVSEHGETDRGEIQEINRVHEEDGLFKTVEAIQVPQELPGMRGPVKAPKQSDIAGRAGLEEANVHSDLGEGYSLRQNVSLSADTCGNLDRSCIPENNRRAQDPVILNPSPEVLYQLESSERSGIVTGGRSSEDPHSQRLVGGAVLSGESHDFGSGVTNQPSAPCNITWLPPITSIVSLGDACQSSVFQSTLSWAPGTSFKRRVSNFLCKQDNEKLPSSSEVIYRRELNTLISRGHFLSDEIINKYLRCLTRHTYGRIAMIGTMDSIRPGLLESLAAFYAIYIPVKTGDSLWTLAILYPGSIGQQGRSEVYDSQKGMATRDASDLLEHRLGDAYSPEDWIVSEQQRGQPQQHDADSGLYLLANAKAMAFNLRMMDLGSSHRMRSNLRWQFTEELVEQRIIKKF
ncbi:hypothetical protein V491_00905 [Pseudogymnoascus sp. VKM F-3775]|nr:hypothetical protein V491_00905 [Pseudogymnoascus sp. VKM F-3775]